jgi:tRNA (guanine-N7-)-methyltransferase
VKLEAQGQRKVHENSEPKRRACQPEIHGIRGNSRRAPSAGGGPGVVRQRQFTLTATAPSRGPLDERRPDVDLCAPFAMPTDLSRPRPPRPYEDAPRLPEGERVDARSLVHGEWLEIEVGPGRGGFVFERLDAEPLCAVIGLEVRRKWAAIVDARIAKRGLSSRGRVFAEDAKSALSRLGPDGAFKRAFLHFPDPWWKKRHTKRLVMGDVFLAEVARLVERGGDLYVQTDVEERAAQYEAQILASGWFDPAGDVPGSPRLAENPFGARSPREHRAIKDGLPVHRMLFRRNDARAPA